MVCYNIKLFFPRVSHTVLPSCREFDPSNPAAAAEFDVTTTLKKLSFSGAVGESPGTGHAAATLPAATAAPPAEATRSAPGGVQVYLRLRPLNATERKTSERKVVDVVDDVTVRFNAPEVRLVAFSVCIQYVP